MLEEYSDNNIVNQDLFPDGKRFRIYFDNVQLEWRILSESHYDFEKILETFSVPNPSAFYSKVYGFNAKKNLYLINNSGYFPIGLIFEVLKYIKNTFGSTNVITMSDKARHFLRDYLLPLKDFIIDKDKMSFEVSNISQKYSLRDYQSNAIKSIIFDGCGRGLLELPTGSGKSFVIANFIYTLLQQYNSELKTLIYVPNKQLVEQFYKDLLDYGYKASDLCKLTGGIKTKDINSNAKIIIGNRQFLFNNTDLIPKVDILIADECHQIAPNSSSYEFIEKINCKIKVGCSGTIPRDKYHRLTLIGLFSRIFYTEDVVKLQKEGYLTNLNITLLNIVDSLIENNRNCLFNVHSKIKYSEDNNIAFNDAYNAEIEYVTNNYEKLYSPTFSYILNNFSGNTLILFDRIEFGKNMFELAKESFPESTNICYIDGSTPVEERENIREIFEKSNNNILFAEVAVMSTGVNIKNLPNIVFMFSGKSLSRVIQSIGRTLRLHNDKKMSNVLDLTFNFKYSRKHLRERLKIYKEFYNKARPDKIVKIEI